MITCRNCNGSGSVLRFTVWLTVEYSGHEWSEEGGRFNSVEEAIRRYADKRAASKSGLLDDHIIACKIIDEANGLVIYECSGWDQISKVSYPNGRYLSEDIGGLFGGMIK